MKIDEILAGIKPYMSNEERELLSLFDDGKVIPRAKFSERQQLIANKLVAKDILLRLNRNDKASYSKKPK